MAHKLISLRQNIKVHQALHGYVDGHREVAASDKLNTHDSKTMLILSDVSSSGVHIEEGGYLTGYPLTDSGYYAIAKTWMAPEMSRPGCVWTHTLLIDFADLANLRSARELLELFRRPILGEITGYSSHLSMEIASDNELDYVPALISPNSSQWLRKLLLALYGRPEKRVTATYSNEFDPVPIVLALWFQQWPRLRRAFCFCTSTTADRSSDRISFDLQLIPKVRGIHYKFPGTIDVEDVPLTTETWLDHAFNDLECPKQGSLRVFLRRVGGDMATGRRAFTTLTRLHKLLEDSESQLGLIDEAIDLMDEEFTDPTAKAARVVVTSKAVSQVKNLSLRALNFLVQNLNVLDKETLVSQAENIGCSMWMKNPATFARLLDIDDAGNIVAASTLASLSNDNLITGLKSATELVAPVLARRPDIVMDPRLWVSDAKIRDAAFDVVQNSPDKWATAIDAMITSGVDDVVKPAFNCFGFAAVWQVLAQELDDAKKVKPHALLPWFEYALLDKGTVAQVLANNRIKMRHSLVTIARMTTPDSVPNAYGVDPWVQAMQGAEGDLCQSEENYLMAYLFRRALGSTSRSSADLAAISFDQVYRATLNNSINDEAWCLLNDSLPNAGWWDSWDRCRRLRQAVAELFLYRNLAAEIFGQLSQDDKIFAEIASTEIHLNKGKSYLKKVRKTLSSNELQQFSERINVIDKLLG